MTLGDDLDSLDNEHLVIGEVTEGLDVIAKLNEIVTDEKNRPYQDIRITHTVVLHDPFPDPEEYRYPDESPRPTAETLASDYISVDETIEDGKKQDEKEINEKIAAKEAEARATILEMVGDIPDADMAPPENVLFVCKLNPVTTSEDLEIIFSRFGKINCAEVIKDYITGNSLQYAFIEFDNKKSCEDAYFKMDNVLIDDRRIHVDFSQSVSKIKWRGRGRGVQLFDDRGKKIDKTATNHNDNPKKSGGSRFINAEEYGKRYRDQHDKSPSESFSFKSRGGKAHENRHYRNRQNEGGREYNRDRSHHRGELDRRRDHDHHDGFRRQEGHHRDQQEVDHRNNRHQGDFRNNQRHEVDHRSNHRNDRLEANHRKNWREMDPRKTRQEGERRPEKRYERSEIHENKRKREKSAEELVDCEKKVFDKEDKRQRLMKKLREDLKKSKESDSSSDSSDEESPAKKTKKKKKKSSRKESSSSSDDSEEEVKTKKNKKKKKHKKKSKKSKH